MISLSLFELVKHVLTSWQVIAVTIGVILYLNIVFFVAKSNRVPKFGSLTKKISFKRNKANAGQPSEGPEEAHSSSSDELGLEED